MHTLLFGWLLLGQTGASSKQDLSYGFAAGDYIVGMKVHFPAPYSGKRLAFYSKLNPGEVCYSADGKTADKCIERFVGAVALVTFSVKLAAGGPPETAAIREHVRVTAQSAGLGERPPFSKTQQLIKGIASDIQVFGYEESTLKQAGYTRAQLKSLWRLYRQELYLNQESKPFAVVLWKHTLDRITIADIYAPPD